MSPRGLAPAVGPPPGDPGTGATRRCRCGRRTPAEASSGRSCCGWPARSGPSFRCGGTRSREGLPSRTGSTFSVRAVPPPAPPPGCPGAGPVREDVGEVVVASAQRAQPLSPTTFPPHAHAQHRPQRPVLRCSTVPTPVEETRGQPPGRFRPKGSETAVGRPLLTPTTASSDPKPAPPQPRPYRGPPDSTARSIAGAFLGQERPFNGRM